MFPSTYLREARTKCEPDELDVPAVNAHPWTTSPFTYALFQRRHHHLRITFPGGSLLVYTNILMLLPRAIAFTLFFRSFSFFPFFSCFPLASSSPPFHLLHREHSLCSIAAHHGQLAGG